MTGSVHDVIVAGAGIAGMESAINLANQGFKVLVIDRNPSIGGKMIGLSKVFPTLDCSSCITTPKMAEAAHHDNITLMTWTDIGEIRKQDGVFEVSVVKKSRFVNEKTCTGCRMCEDACPVTVPHEFDQGLGARKAIYVPFTTAVPQYAVLDVKSCIFCGKCLQACPTEPKSVDYSIVDQPMVLKARSVILASGYEATAINRKKEYHDGVNYKNVVTALQMERLLAPSGPYGGVCRLSDGREPENVAFVHCAGSRDQSIGVPYCSRVCCMFSIKQAMLLSGSLPLANITLYYMDIRAFGKNYEQFYQNAKAMGINFVKAKVAKITELPGGDLELAVEALEDTGARTPVVHDLVVLASGMLPGWDVRKARGVEVDGDGFVSPKFPKEDPAVTQVDGLFVAGAASGPKDIVDTIMEAGSAAMKATRYLSGIRVPS
jgi:heterodisulfide reductase subunit A